MPTILESYVENLGGGLDDKARPARRPELRPVQFSESSPNVGAGFETICGYSCIGYCLLVLWTLLLRLNLLT